MAIFKDLKSYRVRAGLSQNKLASKAGVGRELVSKAEKGEACTIEKLYAILNALNAENSNAKRRTLNADDCIVE